MNQKRKRFCEEYLVSSNGADAAIKAGYSVKTAKNTASWLLTIPEVKQYLAELRDSLKSAKIADTTEIFEFLTAVMRGHSVEQVPLLCGKGYQKLISKGSGIRERLRAAELLGKSLGVFSDKIAIDGVIPVVIMGEDQLEQ